ncbi:cation transporter [Streptomyces sp. NPDC006385]|uniref:heavy-metal-associated domain-containing protein n=1 Tax=Streptomyces sp. NPDC006385 TaxID=3156761 RepID=UPI0033B36A50
MALFSRKKDDTETGPQVVLKVEGMHCSSCGLSIDDELEEVPGVRSASTDVRRGQSTIRLEEGAAVDPDALVAAVRRAGDYMAQSVG